MSAKGYSNFATLANSNKTFLTIILYKFFGKSFSNLLETMQIFAFVELISFLYLIESKKVISFFCAWTNGFTEFTLKSFLKL